MEKQTTTITSAASFPPFNVEQGNSTDTCGPSCASRQASSFVQDLSCPPSQDRPILPPKYEEVAYDNALVKAGVRCEPCGNGAPRMVSLEPVRSLAKGSSHDLASANIPKEENTSVEDEEMLSIEDQCVVKAERFRIHDPSIIERFMAGEDIDLTSDMGTLIEDGPTRPCIKMHREDQISNASYSKRREVDANNPRKGIHFDTFQNTAPSFSGHTDVADGKSFEKEKKKSLKEEGDGHHGDKPNKPIAGSVASTIDDFENTNDLQPEIIRKTNKREPKWLEEAPISRMSTKVERKWPLDSYTDDKENDDKNTQRIKVDEGNKYYFGDPEAE